MSTPSNLRKPEQDYWLAQPQEERGLSPERQQRQPLGFRSKRQYRDESIYGYQDAEYQDNQRDQLWDDLFEMFETDPNEQNFIVSASPAKIEERFKEVARWKKHLEKLRDLDHKTSKQSKINVSVYEEEKEKIVPFNPTPPPDGYERCEGDKGCAFRMKTGGNKVCWFHQDD